MQIHRPILYIISIYLVVLHVFQVHGATINNRIECNKEDIKINSFQHSSGSIYDIIEIKGLINSASESEPLLPWVSRIFRVPKNAGDFSVRIVSYSGDTTLVLKHPICPMKYTEADFNGKGVPDNLGNSYRLNPIQPKVNITDSFFLNGDEHYVRVLVSPVCYNGPENIATVYSDIEIELSYSESIIQKDISHLQTPQQSRMFHFDEYISCLGESISNAPSLEANSESLPSTYVIVVPESLKDAVRRLGKWKKQKGYNVIIETVEDILRNPSYLIQPSTKCFDKEASVREWLKDIYSTHGAFYCLIVGDYRTSAPIRKFKEINKDLSDPNDNAYLPTDVYFSDLFSEWIFTLDSSGLYSTYYRDDSPFSPTISVGRLLASEESEIENFTDKVILYELYPGLGNSSYLTKGFLGRHKDSVWWNSDSNNNLFSYMSGFDITQIDGTTGEKLANVTPTSKEVLDCLKNVGLATLQYHGGPICLMLSQATKGWPDSHFLLALTDYRHAHKDKFLGDAINGMDYLENRFSPSIMYSLACTLAPFDEKFLSEYPGLADIQTKSHTLPGIFTVAKDFGGPVFLANTREGHLALSAAMERDFGKYIGTGCNVGEAENLSKILITRAKYKLVHSIIGDPEINIWIKNPNFIDSDVHFNYMNILFDNLPMRDVNIGITAGNYYQQKKYTNVAGLLSIPLESILGQNENIGLASVYLRGGEVWPETFLLPISEVINNTNQSYQVARFQMGAKERFSNCPFLKLGCNSSISINSFTNITSNSSIEIQKGGVLSLEALNKIVTEADSVKEGGTLTLKAKRIEVEKGCVIEKGGKLTISNLKE